MRSAAGVRRTISFVQPSRNSRQRLPPRRSVRRPVGRRRESPGGAELRVRLARRSAGPQDRRRLARTPVPEQQLPMLGGQQRRPDVLAGAGPERRTGARDLERVTVEAQGHHVPAGPLHRGSDARGVGGGDAHGPLQVIPQAPLAYVGGEAVPQAVTRERGRRGFWARRQNPSVSHTRGHRGQILPQGSTKMRT